MGFYVNPPSMEKEQFLEKYGERLNCAPNEDFDFSGDFLPVCWIHNGSFSAAGIVYSVRELHAFSNPSDKRPKLWFLVKKEHLEEKAGMYKGWIKEAQECDW